MNGIQYYWIIIERKRGFLLRVFNTKKKLILRAFNGIKILIHVLIKILINHSVIVKRSGKV